VRAGTEGHIDLHVRYFDKKGSKFPGLDGVDELKQAIPYIQPGMPINFGR